MLKAYNLSTRLRIIADIIILTLIIIITQRWLINDNGTFVSDTQLVIIIGSLGLWFFSARTFGLYEDFREIPFSQEWIVFLKTQVLYALLVSFMFFSFFNQYPYSRSHILIHCSLIFVFSLYRNY